MSQALKSLISLAVSDSPAGQRTAIFQLEPKGPSGELTAADLRFIDPKAEQAKELLDAYRHGKGFDIGQKACELFFSDDKVAQAYMDADGSFRRLMYGLDDTAPIRIPLTADPRGHFLSLHPGVFILFSQRAGGKTKLAEYIASYLDAEDPLLEPYVIRFGEPEPRTVSGRSTLTTSRQLLTTLASALLSPHRVIIIDSFRQLIFESGGATGTGGVNLRILPVLTQLSQIASRLGKTILITWNPQSGKPEVVNEWLIQLESAVTSLLVIQTPNMGTGDGLARPTTSKRDALFVTRAEDLRAPVSVHFDIAYLSEFSKRNPVAIEEQEEAAAAATPDDTPASTIGSVSSFSRVFPKE